MKAEYKRTDFVYDTVPWKLVFCPHSRYDCESVARIYIDGLPEAPEPGRIPEGCDHVHVVPKYSGERDARDEEKWRALLLSTGRCEHGRAQMDACVSCPGGISPDVSGKRIGTAYDGVPVVVPPREDWAEIKNWTPTRKRPSAKEM